MSTEAELRAELERLKRENEALKSRPKTATSPFGPLNSRPIAALLFLPSTTIRRPSNMP